MRKTIGLALILTALAISAQHASAQLAEKKVLTLAAAQKMVAAAQAEAERNHLAGVIAVVDDGGWLILLVRMDNSAFVASVELAPRPEPPHCSRNRVRRWKTPSITAGSRPSPRVVSSRCKVAFRLSSMARSSGALGRASIPPSTTCRLRKLGSPPSHVKFRSFYRSISSITR
jgi:hypothetical protein